MNGTDRLFAVVLAFQADGAHTSGQLGVRWNELPADVTAECRRRAGKERSQR